MNISKKILVAATAVSAILCATQASAADLYTPEPEPVSTWTGFWIGGGVGYGMVNHELSGAVGTYGEESTDSYTASLSGIGGEGWLGRVGAGYDFQVADSFVLGIFGDYTFSGIDSTLKVGKEKSVGGVVEKSANLFNYKLKAENSWFIGGRAGYLINPETLAYGLVGYSEVDFKANYNWNFCDAPECSGGDSYSYTNGGITWGGGLESMVTEAFSVKAEYRYQDLDSKTILDLEWGRGPDGGAFAYLKTDTNIQTFVVSGQYRF